MAPKYFGSAQLSNFKGVEGILSEEVDANSFQNVGRWVGLHSLFSKLRKG